VLAGVDEDVAAGRESQTSHVQFVNNVGRTPHQLRAADCDGRPVVEGVAVDVKPQFNGQPEEGWPLHRRGRW